MKCLVISDLNENSHAGWLPVDEYALKISSHLGAQIYYPPGIKHRRLQRALPNALAEQLRADAPDADVLLIIARNSVGLGIIQHIKNLKKKYQKIYAWVADSYFLEGYDSSTALYDCIAVTDEADAQWVTQKFGVKCVTVRQGIDTLGLAPPAMANRSIDLIGFGRLPSAYHQAFCDRFHTPASSHLYLHSPIGNLTGPSVWKEKSMLHKVLQRTRFSLAFHMLCNPEMHRPKSMMVTSRWLESLAAGCIVVGKKPISKMADEMLFWPNVTIELPDDPQTSAEFLEELMNQSDDAFRANRNANVMNMMRHHDIHDRIIDLLNVFSLEVPATLLDESARIHEAAARFSP